MTIGSMAKFADSLEQDVREALEGDPLIHTEEIGVAVEDGMVTLTGNVASVREAVAAERAVKLLDGVRSIANALHVKERNERTDIDIAREALHRLRNNVAVPLTVQAIVREGQIRLEGMVSWAHQRDAAENAVRYLSGVKGVTNDILMVQHER